jgi:hypothetical protein
LGLDFFSFLSVENFTFTAFLLVSVTLLFLTVKFISLSSFSPKSEFSSESSPETEAYRFCPCSKRQGFYTSASATAFAPDSHASLCYAISSIEPRSEKIVGAWL